MFLFKKFLLNPAFRPKLSWHSPFKKMSAYSKHSGYALSFIIAEGFLGGEREAGGMLDNSERRGRKPNKFLGTVQFLS